MYDDRLSAERNIPPGGSKKLIMTQYLKLRKVAKDKHKEGKNSNEGGAGLT